MLTEGEATVQAAIDYVSELFVDNSGGHDAGHTLRVWQNAMLIAQTEPSCDALVVALAALLHDADDYKLFHTEGNANARAFLEQSLVDTDRIEQICEAINTVSFTQNRGQKPETIEGMIVQDADRLDALGAIGIARTFAFGGEHGRSLEDSVQHFFDKLLLLKDEMNTQSGRELAESRHDFLCQFLQHLKEEMFEENSSAQPLVQ
ncbi:MAG: HD domain-containing protein [Atopobiaceae bacterium]|nr:HD domain-containing protein [Atopobiaceae bacterium]